MTIVDLTALAVVGTRDSYFQGSYLEGEAAILVVTGGNQWDGDPIGSHNNVFDFGILNGSNRAIRVGSGAADDSFIVGNIFKADKVLSGTINNHNIHNNIFIIKEEQWITSNTSPINVWSQNEFSIPAGSYQNVFNITGRRVELCGGSIIGFLAGLRITVDGIVIIDETSSARGYAGSGGDVTTVRTIPSGIRAENSLKVEVYNGGGSPSDYGWTVYTRYHDIP